jgi:hypothetical protein
MWCFTSDFSEPGVGGVFFLLRDAVREMPVFPQDSEYMAWRVDAFGVSHSI